MQELVLPSRFGNILSRKTQAALSRLPAPQEARDGDVISVSRTFHVGKDFEMEMAFDARFHQVKGDAIRPARIGNLRSPHIEQLALASAHLCDDDPLIYYGLDALGAHAHQNTNEDAIYHAAGFPHGVIFITEHIFTDRRQESFQARMRANVSAVFQEGSSMHQVLQSARGMAMLLEGLRAGPMGWTMSRPGPPRFRATILPPGAPG